MMSTAIAGDAQAIEQKNNVELKLVPTEPIETKAVPVPPFLKETAEEPPLIENFGVPSKVYTGKEFLENSQNNLIPIVDNLIYEKTLNMVVGRAKGGKSTFSRYLMKCVLDNEKFLAHKTESCKVLYLPLDEPAALIKIGLSKVNIEKLDDLHITKLEGDQNDLEQIVKICQHVGIKLVVVDLISKIMDVEDSNKYTEVSRCLRKFRDISEEFNIAFVFLHHSTKANPKSVLGSQSIAGAMDNIIYITDSGGKYFYESDGRFDNIEPTEIVLNPDNNHLMLHELTGLSDEEAVLHVVQENTELSKSAIAKMVRKNKAKTLALVDELVEDNKLTLENGKYRVITARKEDK